MDLVASSVVLTVIEWRCSTTIVFAWPWPSPVNEFVLGQGPAYSH